MSDRQSHPLFRPFILAVVGILFLAFCIFAINHLLHKPNLPAEYGVDSPFGQVLTVGGIPVTTDEDVEFLLSRQPVGDSIAVTVNIAEESRTMTLPVVPYYGVIDVAFSVTVAVLILAIGLAVLYHQPSKRTSRVFTLATAVLASAILGTKTLFTTSPPNLGIILGGWFFLAYSTIAVQFFHFTLLFPVERTSRTGRFVAPLYLCALVIGIWQASVYMDAAMTGSIGQFRESVRGAIWLNAFVVAVVVLSLINLVVSYREAGTRADRQRLRWILYGLTIGTTPFVFFWALPQAFGLSPWIPELLFKFFLLAIPVTFAIAIIRYHLMDIDFVINRSVVYSIVLGILLVLYAGFVGLVAEMASAWTMKISLTVSTIAAMVVALLFEPLRRSVQRVVNRSFFRITYDFRESFKTFSEGLKGCHDDREIARVLIGHIDAVVPVDRVGYFALVRPGNRLRLLSHTGFGLLESHGIGLDVARITSPLHIPIALPACMDPAVTFERADEAFFRRWGMALVIPLRSTNTGILGFLALGEKKAGTRFLPEDIDLLTAISTGAASEIERIHLQQSVMLEHAEAQRLEELNRLKSFFVSSVSHDLKTPLTSIALFAEILKSDREIGQEEVREYLSIIEGESRRLTRLIDNVLDFAKIERGVKEYHMRETELSSVVEKALASMKYQFTMMHCELRENYPEDPIIIIADPDAVTEAVINLLTNALKYSGDTKKISVGITNRDGGAAVSVTDNGQGIEEADRARLFEPFYRAASTAIRGTGGAGLGLSIVKHIMDAHGGNIEIDSTPGKGSTFTLVFPAG